VCNAYTELNDPLKQRELFGDQASAKDEGGWLCPCVGLVCVAHVRRSLVLVMSSFFMLKVGGPFDGQG